MCRFIHSVECYLFALPRAVEAAYKLGVRILVVDDIPDVAETLGDLLRELGHEVHLAYSGAAALLLAPEFRPEVIFCDLAMPHLDGLMVGECLRQRPELRTSTLVAWTGFADQHYQDLARRSGFDAYLVKPGPIEEFLARLPTHGHAA